MSRRKKSTNQDVEYTSMMSDIPESDNIDGEDFIDDDINESDRDDDLLDTFEQFGMGIPLTCFDGFDLDEID